MYVLSKTRLHVQFDRIIILQEDASGSMSRIFRCTDYSIVDYRYPDGGGQFGTIRNHINMGIRLQDFFKVLKKHFQNNHGRSEVPRGTWFILDVYEIM